MTETNRRMSPMLLRFLFLVLFALSLVPASAYAQQNDEYADITWPNLMRTIVRFNAMNIADPVLLDEYAIVTECELYKVFYPDDFKWNNVRNAVRESIKLNVATFPVSYRFDL